MSVNAKRNKDTGKWDIQYRYTDWRGKERKSTKRGFERKRDAEEWFMNFLLTQQESFDMRFKDFIEQIYFEDMTKRLKQSTMRTKKYIINDKILPTFGDMRVNDIAAANIRKWQATLIEQGFSETYLRTIHNQMTCLFNYAVKYYDLKSNPCKKAGTMGKKESGEMLFWTQDEYMKFADAMMDKPQSFYAFEMLYYCGIRLGELLALTPSAFNFVKKTVSITQSYQRLEREDIITDPKTPKSNRVIAMPKFLCEEMQEYINMLYGIQSEDRIFTITKSYLHHEMDRGSQETGVKRIRIHDLRHSHVSLLIEMGFSALAIAERLGHESIDITYRYAHLFPTRQTEIADKLDMERGENGFVGKND